MENIDLTKFKQALERQLKNRKELITICEEELKILTQIIEETKKIINRSIIDKVINKLITKNTENNITHKFIKIRYFCYPSNNIEILIEKSKKGNKQAFNELLDLYNKFKTFCEYLNNSINELNYYLTAYQDNGLILPINDIKSLFEMLTFTNLTYEEISKVLGITITFDYGYAIQNNKHTIKNIDLIQQLINYYNEDGTFKENDDLATFEYLMRALIGNGALPKEINAIILGHYRIIDTSIFSMLLSVSNFNYNKEQEKNKDKPNQNCNHSPKITNYYNNGELIDIPKDLDKFYQELDNSNIPEEEKNNIKLLVRKKQKEIRTLKYLKVTDREIYLRAKDLIDTKRQDDPDIIELKTVIEELQLIINELEMITNELYKQELLEKIPKLIIQLENIIKNYNSRKKLTKK